MTTSTCIGCGCDDFHACPGGCFWRRVDKDARLGVCSECEGHVEAWDRGDRTPHAVPAAEHEALAEGLLRIMRPEQRKPIGGGPCMHDWPYEDVRDSDRCRWCGMSFVRHVFTECP